MDPIALWESSRHKTLDATQESIGKCPRTRQNFTLLQILKATDVCRMAHLNGNRDLLHSLGHRASTLLRRDKEQFIRNLAKKVEGRMYEVVCENY